MPKLKSIPDLAKRSDQDHNIHRILKKNEHRQSGVQTTFDDCPSFPLRKVKLETTEFQVANYDLELFPVSDGVRNVESNVVREDKSSEPAQFGALCPQRRHFSPGEYLFMDIVSPTLTRLRHFLPASVVSRCGGTLSDAPHYVLTSRYKSSVSTELLTVAFFEVTFFSLKSFHGYIYADCRQFFLTLWLSLTACS